MHFLPINVFQTNEYVSFYEVVVKLCTGDTFIITCLLSSDPEADYLESYADLTFMSSLNTYFPNT